MEEEDTLLQVDDSFFDSLPASGRSLVESVQAKALLEEADIEGEAAEAVRSHHSFQTSFNPHPQLNHSNIHPRDHVQDLLLGLDDFPEDDDGEEQEDPEENRPVKKYKLNSSDSNQIKNNTANEGSSKCDDDHQLQITRQESLVDHLEVDDSFIASLDPDPKGFEKSNTLAAEALSKNSSKSIPMDLELEMDEEFITRVDSIPVAPVKTLQKYQPVIDDAAPSFDDMLNEAENYEEEDYLSFDPQFTDEPQRPVTVSKQKLSDSFSEMLNEAESQQEEDHLGIDSQFSDSHINGRPTSAQQLPTAAASSSALTSRNSLAAEINLTTNASKSRWIPDTSMVATRLDGTQIQLPRRKRIDPVHPSGSRSTEELQQRRLDILDQPIHRMLAKAREEISVKNALPPTVATVPKQNSDAKTNSLWTDRYRPVKFIDLIGDERVFRSAMGWLKTWDKCVFKKVESSHKRKRMLKSLQQQSNSNYQSNSLPEMEVDPFGRPKEKVLLLSGKPGLGKTTMAQVLANQAGYQVIEINASDDRSSKTVTEHIKTALESRTLDYGAKTGGGLSLKDNRPTCVIIDEIDGAAGGGGGNDTGFVKALVQLITEGSTQVLPKTSKKSRKTDKRPLLRPIICICNDLYAPVLRPLRPISRIIRFSSPTPTTLVKRLQTICKSENLTADMNNLSYLVKLSKGDLRSCLNTLQFISDQEKTKVLNDQIIKSAVDSGVKDSTASVQTVLSRLFRIPVGKSANKSSKDGSTEFYLNDLVRDISTCGQNERIVQGCFEFYLNMKQPTDTWQSYSRLFDWLEFYDRLETRIWDDQAYQLLSYVPYAISIWREIFGNLNNKAPLEYPKVEYENHSKRLINEEILATFKHIIPPTISSSFKSQEIVCEFLPFLIRSISVDLRPVNSKLVKKEEKEILVRVVQTMLHLGLKFVQDKSEDGQLSYTLEPPIDFSVNYEGARPADIPPARYSVRQMILNEMNSRAMRREMDAASGTAGGDSEIGSARSIINAYQRKPNQMPKSIGENENVKLDFFGRKQFIETTDGNGRKSLNAGDVILKEKVEVLYRYHEGFSNAVKKPITMKELMSK